MGGQHGRPEAPPESQHPPHVQDPAPILVTGLGVTGRLSYDEWDKNGTRQNRTYITASRLEFLDPATPAGTHSTTDPDAKT